MRASDKDMKLEVLPPSQRISVEQLHLSCQQNDQHLLIDVRSENEYDICHLEHSENHPIKLFNDPNSKGRKALVDRIKAEHIPLVYVVCRRGNDSQIATKILLEETKDCDVKIFDIIGGLHAWTDQIDEHFPKY